MENEVDINNPNEYKIDVYTTNNTRYSTYKLNIYIHFKYIIT